MQAETIYLDHNATTPLRNEAREAMMNAMGPALNPSSIHSQGRHARQQLEEARRAIADAFFVRHHDLVFTSGGTEANNMVLSAFKTVIVSAVEHDAVLAPRPEAHRLPVDQNGVVRLDELETLLDKMKDEDKPHALVSIMAANNETGVLQPIKDIGALCAKHNVAFHSDMVQAAGKMHLDLSIEGLSFASFSAHKIGGPTGVGALWVKAGLQIPSLLKGGGQEQGRRAGTENSLGIIGFGAAMTACVKQLSYMEELAKMRDEFERYLLSKNKEITILGADAPRLANTSAIALPHMPSSLALMALDLKGFCLSSGSACSSGKVKSSHVIEAMGQTELANHILRISGGWTTNKDDFQKLATVLLAL